MRCWIKGFLKQEGSVPRDEPLGEVLDAFVGFGVPYAHDGRCWTEADVGGIGTGIFTGKHNFFVNLYIAPPI